MNNSDEAPKQHKPWFLTRILGYIGVERARDRRLGFRLRRRILLTIAVMVVVLVAMSAGIVYYTETPGFCRSCHIMEPYYKAWATSKHNHVKCVECHYPPGSPDTILWHKFQAISQVVKYVTRTYSSKPFAEIEDGSCLREGCHSTRLLRGRVISAKGVVFDHRPHLEQVRKGRQLRCVSCHSQVVVGSHIEVTWDTCYLCHLHETKGIAATATKGEPAKVKGAPEKFIGDCLRCHTMPSRKIKLGNISYSHKDFLATRKIACQSCHRDVTQGHGSVSKTNCLTCHNEPDKLARYNEETFIHDTHVTSHNVPCYRCHEQIRHGHNQATTTDMGEDCAACHSQMHDPERSLYKGEGARGIPAMPSPMFLANVNCSACHLKEKPDTRDTAHGVTLTGSEKGCIACHGKEYVGTLAAGESLIKETVAKLQAKLKALDHAEAPVAVRKTLQDVSRNLRFVRSTHSGHNVYYAASILRQANDALDVAAKAMKIKVQDFGKLPIISGGFCATLCHSKVGVKVPPDTVTFRKKEMPHKAHIEDEGLACTKCHIFGGHKDLKLKPVTVCAECHEAEELK